jgi:hypothetical protein
LPWIGKAIGVAEGRFGQADFARPLCHQLRERGLVAGNTFGKHDRGVVRRLDDDAMQEIIHGYLAVDRNKHA